MSNEKENLYIRPLTEGEVRVTTEANEGKYRPIRASKFFGTDGGLKIVSEQVVKCQACGESISQ